MERDPLNRARLIAYFIRIAPYRAADQAGYFARYVRGLEVQRNLHRPKAQTAASVIPLPRKGAARYAHWVAGGL